MKKSDFHFDLPDNLIAQKPKNPRDASRMLYLPRNTNQLYHHHFYDLPTLLQEKDLLVINNTKVIPARLLGHKQGRDALCELLLLKEETTNIWECLARPGKRIRPGDCLVFGDESLKADILETLDNGSKRVRFRFDTVSLYEKLDQFGEMPLPPYIQGRDSLPSDYQTVYAKYSGSAAAPTAGLHFTTSLLDNLKQKNIGIAEVTLHVGLGTFRPVQAENVADHQMHAEYYSIPKETELAIQQTKDLGGRVIAVGTTSCRCLEATAQQHGKVVETQGETDIFITPGYTFSAIDGLITNFHLPESTLLMLVSAFHGRENTLHAYKQAVENEYRFFSFGDSMLII